MATEISVIIPALNEEKYIGGALDGLKAQTFRKFETIIVDGGSGDRTREIAEGKARIIVSRKRGAGRARNIGAMAAVGGVLLFLDADTVPSRNLLKTYSNIMKDKEVVAATGPILPLERASPRFRYGYRFVSVTFVKLSVMLGRPTFIGSNFAVRKSAFDNVRGFREGMLSYEDWELSYRLKKEGRMVYSMDAVVRTSIRRVKKWGIRRYFFFYVTNFLKFHLFKESRKDYTPVR